MASTPLTICGAGICGLAIASRLAGRFPGLVLLEKERRHGQGISSRSSEVIHSGIYYPPGSKKAQLCREGRERLYALCAKRGIGHRKTGKLVVAAVTEELPALDRLSTNAAACGVPAELLTGAEAVRLEPSLSAQGALLVRETGILDSEKLMEILLRQAERNGAIFLPSARLVGLEPAGKRYRLQVERPDGLETFTTDRLVNAAGLGAGKIADLLGLADPPERLLFAKGSYFKAAPRHHGILHRLCYPIPKKNSLGIHSVLDLSGGLRFGPDCEPATETLPDLAVNPDRRKAFGQAIRRYLPMIQDDDLFPDYAGIRPKLKADPSGFQDFIIREESAKGFPGVVQLIGIESPGLTAALAIARQVETLLS